MKDAVEVVVNDRMQQDYRCTRTAAMGKAFDAGFHPELIPAEMLELGVFCGKYMTDRTAEFPASWFKDAKLSSERPDGSLNYFGIRASVPLHVWAQKGWIHPDNPRGWFQ